VSGVDGGESSCASAVQPHPGSSSQLPVDASSSPSVADVVRKVIRVLREPGVALGMSVAGGIGALPDAHDEVFYWFRVNSAFHPSWVGKWVVVHVFTWITKADTIKTAVSVHMAVCLRVKVRDRGLGLRPRCAPSLSVTTAQLRRQFWRYLNEPYLYLLPILCWPQSRC